MTEQIQGGTLFDLIKSKADTFSRAEKKVAREILSDYPAAGLQTVAELAKSSSVSSQTVIRFVATIGFRSYPAFHGQLIEELRVRNATPLARYDDQKFPLNHDSILGNCLKNLAFNLADTMARLPEAEFANAVELLSDIKRPVVSTGGRSTGLMSQYFILQLQQMRPLAQHLSEETVPRAHAVLEMSNKSVVVIYDVRRYSENALVFAEAAKERGVQIILITDVFLSPVSKVADVVLPVRIEFLTPFDSHLAGIAVTETLVAGITKNLEDSFAGRMAAYEGYRQRL